MPAENSRKGTPPYISPITFRSLITELQRNMPDRIDRSYLNTLHSGSTSTQVMSAMRYLNLVDVYDKPTHHLKLLVAAASSEEKVKRLSDIAHLSYAFLLNNSAVDIQAATYAQLEENFKDFCGVEGDVRRKCIKFFTSLAGDAGISLSPHVVKKIRMGRGSAVSKPSPKKVNSKTMKVMEIPQQAALVPQYDLLFDKLLGKFPDMDVTWSNEMKQLWMESFNQFMLRAYEAYTQSGKISRTGFPQP
jgi:hypothetical protein